MANSAADRRAQQQYANDMETARIQREWNIEDRDEARVYSRQVLGHLVQDAQAAGFNPLTVLRNGGGASYNAAAAFAPLSRTAPTRQAPYQGHMGEAIATAGGRIADFMADFDPHADAAREQGSRFIEAQIANLEASTSGIRSNMLARETRNSGRAATLSGAALATGPEPEAGDRTVTNPWHDGEVHPLYLDAEAFEARYGDSEIAQMAFGARNMIADHFWNTEREIRKHVPAYRKKVEAGERRAARIRADAARNAAELGFPVGW